MAFGRWRDEVLDKKETTMTLANFLRTAISPRPSQDITNGELIVWWENYMAVAAKQNVSFRGVTLHCLNEVCETMSWEGNADISGIGMMIVYVVEAILVTMYTVAWILRRRGHKRLDPNLSHKQSSKTHLQVSFHGSAPVFLVTAIVFSSAVQVASIVIMIRAVTQNGDDWVEFTTSLDVTLFSLLAIVVLSLQVSTSQPRLRGQKFRVAFNILVTLVFFVQLTTYITRYFPGVTWLEETGFPFVEGTIIAKSEKILSMCLQLEGRAVFIVTTILWTCGAVVLSAWAASPFVVRPPSLAKVESDEVTETRQPLDQFELYLFTGASVGLFAVFASYIAHRITYHGFGQAVNEGNWTFGQIMALFTWVPVVVEFACIHKRKFLFLSTLFTASFSFSLLPHPVLCVALLLFLLDKAHQKQVASRIHWQNEQFRSLSPSNLSITLYESTIQRNDKSWFVIKNLDADVKVHDSTSVKRNERGSRTYVKRHNGSKASFQYKACMPPDGKIT